MALGSIFTGTFAELVRGSVATVSALGSSLLFRLASACCFLALDRSALARNAAVFVFPVPVAAEVAGAAGLAGVAFEVFASAAAAAGWGFAAPVSVAAEVAGAAGLAGVAFEVFASAAAAAGWGFAAPVAIASVEGGSGFFVFDEAAEPGDVTGTAGRLAVHTLHVVRELSSTDIRMGASDQSIVSLNAFGHQTLYVQTVA